MIHLTQDPGWAPAGALSPIRLPEAGPETWFAFAPGDPPAPQSPTAGSVFGTEALVEKPAGARGPLPRLGSDLITADGTPIKLWGLNASPAGSASLREQQAAFYALMGINLIRFHPVESFLGPPLSGAQLLDPYRVPSRADGRTDRLRGMAASQRPVVGSEAAVIQGWGRRGGWWQNRMASG